MVFGRGCCLSGGWGAFEWKLVKPFLFETQNKDFGHVLLFESRFQVGSLCLRIKLRSTKRCNIGLHYVADTLYVKSNTPIQGTL